MEAMLESSNSLLDSTISIANECGTGISQIS